MSGGDGECPFCWGTGQITVMEPTLGRLYDDTTGRAVVRPCPEGCPAPEEVPF